jgi:uncharacterized membrane protein (UPF0127 family)
MVKMLNETKGTVVAEQVQVADTFWSRLVGLMGRRSLPEGQGMWISRSNSIHTAFMRFRMDAVFLDREMRVVKVAPRMGIFRVAAAFRGGYSVVELPAGAAAKAKVEVGDQLVAEGGDGGG